MKELNYIDNSLTEKQVKESIQRLYVRVADMMYDDSGLKECVREIFNVEWEGLFGETNKFDMDGA